MKHLAVFIVAWAVAAVAWPQGQWAEYRNRMVDEDIVAAGVKNQRVIAAMRNTPRHEFVPNNQRKMAYYDMALPIGESQTISSPFTVAFMTEQLDPKSTDKVLEIGTGSGYQAAVLSQMVSEVYTIEIVTSLGRKAMSTLKRLGYDNVHVKVGDGFAGWPEHAPFDKIIVTCSPEKAPRPLVEQLKEGGRMIIPLGERYQQMFYLFKKKDGKLVPEALRPTLFVPMTGAAESQRQVKPDPLHPELRNGDFEETEGNPPAPTGWHYQKNLTLLSDGRAPSGKNYVQFTNTQLGRVAQALQGFAVDGRKIPALGFSFSVRGRELRPGEENAFPQMMISFYDENRAMLGMDTVATWRGSFAWEQQTHIVRVPPQAREAILFIGLGGGFGELALDAIKLTPMTTAPAAKTKKRP